MSHIQIFKFPGIFFQFSQAYLNAELMQNVEIFTMDFEEDESDEGWLTRYF